MDNTWYTCLNYLNTSIYNGIIVTPPNNPILYSAISYILNNNKPKYYWEYVTNLFNLIKTSSNNKKLQVGENKLQNGWNCILFREYCRNCGKKEKCDVYNKDCEIKNKRGEILFKTRYKDFPW